MTKIDMKEAVRTAKATINDLFADDPLKGLALEEIEFVDEDGHPRWAVTLGFHRSKSVSMVPGNAIGAIFQKPSEVEHRVYKIVYIDADTGDFVKMDMRNVQ
jgi:hypothetical protein